MRCELREKSDVWDVSDNTPRRLQWIAIDCKRNQLYLTGGGDGFLERQQLENRVEVA